MKKTILFGLAAAMLVAACSEEDDLRQGIAGEGITFTSSVMSRATDTNFEPRDAIGISMYADEALTSAVNVQYVTEDGSAFTSQNPVTWGMAGGAATADFVGVYPYKADAVANGIYKITLSTEEGASLSKNDVMYAKNTSGVGEKNVSLNFSHKLVKVVMQIYDEDGNGISGAQVKINNQQTTVATTGAADQELQFASNSSITGQYQTIVMPSEAMQGRIITITYKGNDYPCPVDAYVFEIGKRIAFSATINSNGAVSPGQPIQVSADVTKWDDVVIESGWIFGEGEQFEVTGKTAYELATNVALNSTATEIGEFEGMLDANDVYSLEYTIEEAADGAAISISGKPYSLPAGKASGTILIAVGKNTTGISVSSKNTGITLTKVSVYTNESIGLPITLWTGNGTAGNGIAGEEGLENAGYRPIMARIKLSDQQLKMLTPGAILRCYFDEGVTEESQAELLWLGTLRMHFNGSLGSFDINSHSLINVVTRSMCDEVAVNNGEMIFVKDWSDPPVQLQLNRIELVPNTDKESDYSNLLWCHMIEQEEIGKENDGDCWLDYGTLKMGVPASLKSGDIIKVTYVSASEGAYFEGVPEPQGDETVIFNKQIETEGNGVAEIAVDENICQRLLELRENREDIGIKSLTIRGQKVAIHKIQLVRGSEE